MQIASRFTIAVHTLACMEYFKGEHKITSEFIAKSTCCNPVIIRRMLSLLAKHGIIKTKAGVGGSEIIKPLSEINLLEIFQAVNAVEGSLFSMHGNADCPCPLGKTMSTVLQKRLSVIDKAVHDRLAGITMQDILDDSGKAVSEIK